MAGVLQHLRSSTLNKRPNPASMVDGQIAINYASGSPGAFFKDTNGNLVKVGPVHVGATAPNVSPASGGTAGNSLGEQWLDTSGGTYVFKIWDGAAWRSEAGEFVNSTGDTMTGSLTMGPSANLIFEGSTDDGFETTLTVVDPTADRTITLPNVSGTVVTTGDSGTVTSTMIADGTIVNADVNASAAIAGTKISPDFGSQTIQTTGVFSHALGSASSPTVTFTGDTNTGIYSPGADQVAISTGGSGRLFVSQNRTGVNINPTAFQLQVNENSGAASYVHITNSDTGTTGSDGALIGLDSDEHLIVWNQEAKDLRLATSGQERLRITSAGLVGVGTSSPFTILHSAISITGGNPASSGTTDANVIARFQGGSVGLDIGGTASGAQWIQPRSVNNFATNYGLLLCPNGGNVGIGTTSPSAIVHSTVSSAGVVFRGSHNNSGIDLYANDATGEARITATRLGGSGGKFLSFYTDTGTGEFERARIDSSGRLGVGTSSPGTTLDVKGSVRSSIGTGTGAGGAGYALYQFGTSSTAIENWHIGAEGDGSFRFYNQGIGAGIERLRITSAGNVGIGTTSPTHSLDVNSAIRLRGAGASTEEGDLHLYYVSDSNRATVTSSTNGAIVFENGIGAVSERARIDSSGRLLVGTSSARSGIGSRIQLEGAGGGAAEELSLVYNGENTVGPRIDLVKTRGAAVGANTAVINNDELGLIRFYGADGTSITANNGASIGAYVDGEPFTSGDTTDLPTRLVFSTTADGASSPTERMRITSDGSVLLNTGGSTIEVTTGTVDGAYYNSPAKQLVLSRDGGGSLTLRRRSSDGTIQGFYRDGTVVGTISVTTTATAYNTSSDYRLKENVTAVTDGITRLQQLKPSRFNFIADPDKTVDGFLAHEVQTIVPEAITGEKDAVDDEGNPQYQGIDQSKLVPLLTAALQEAVAKIESLEARLTAAGI